MASHVKAVPRHIALACVLYSAVFSLSLAEHADASEGDIYSDFNHDRKGELCADPFPPMFAELNCGTNRKNRTRYVCKAQCEEGFEFPNGKVKKRHICDLTTGRWTPESEFPDCKVKCEPPCENRGECAEDNHCICPPVYRGDRCQFETRLCDPGETLHVSADWKCNHTAFETLCTLNCPQGTQYESPPAEIYRCSLDGKWAPDVAPKCLPINIIEPPASHGLFPIDTGRTDINENIRTTSSGVCAAWGQLHYRTFDGGMFSFQGPCSYLLAKDCTEDTFAIHIGNQPSCNSASSCLLSVTIYLGKEEHQLLRTPEGPSVLWQGQKYPIPTSLNGMLFQMLSNYLSVTSSSLGFRLKWDGKSTILLKVNDQLKNKTCGLCGRFDGTVLNDFEMSDGKITDNVEAFVNSWTMDTFAGACSKGALVQHPCSPVEKDTAVSADKICGVISDAKYSACHYLVDPRAYSEACKMDYCACSDPTSDCICNSLGEYFRECARLGGKIEGGWRNNDLCPLSCPNGMVYDDCGTSCPRTCKSTVYDCEDSHCIDGCHCPAGTVMNSGQCIEKEHCPCLHKGKEYGNGERITQECNACECFGGKWECTNEKCQARCSSVGDPHYTTFDGSKYEFLGKCPYYLVYHDNFTIVQENGPCPTEDNGMEKEVATTTPRYCTQSIVIEYEGSTLVLKPNTGAVFNDKEIHNYPFSENGISVSLASSMFLEVELPNGLSLMWDGKNRIYIDAPPSLFGQTKGLCGTFNNNQKDDFLTPENDVEADVSVFASRWKASDSCHVRSRRSDRSPCGLQPQKAQDAQNLCALMKSHVFEDCHDDVDPESYYRGCIYDLCACSDNLESCLCPALADYAAACARKGSIILWAEEITPCRPHCENGQIYKECGNPCKSTCSTISLSGNCKEKCVQGCSCPDGMTINGDGFCVPVNQCPCVYEGKEYTCYSLKLQGSNICQCENALWKCKPATLEELVRMNPDLVTDDKPVSCQGRNKEFTPCVEDCPSTCQNMHLAQKCKTRNCKPGCRCKEGYVLDSDLDRCVKPTECGCRHGGRKYAEEETIKKDCNRCTCVLGLWKCTERVCPGVCTVWGESHFKTFDDRIYDFHGECEYILSKGGHDTSAFTLSIQNVPCGTSGITCSKSFTLDLGGGSKITLSKGEPLPQNGIGSPFTILEVRFFVSVYTDIGLSIQWDKGTRIYLTLDPSWRDRVAGLCGNFNDDQSDDFRTPSGGIPEARPSVFADSWKIHEFCPHPQTIEDACSVHPDRQNWAQQKCSILKSDVFAPCHAEVGLEPYHERCVFDACACDIGGDCDCLCTAIAAYAQECNVHGVPVKWRTQELCPIQCEECSTYESCMNPCPRSTCENQKLFDEKVCAQETCVEGCNPKPCPPGQIYSNSKDLKCIPQAECVIPCMEVNGRVYNEGERITDSDIVDACQSCHCLGGEILCTGQPCPITTEKPISPLRVPCAETGWTPWMNTPRVVGGDFISLKDFEIESAYSRYCGLSNATSIECRDAESKVTHKETGQNLVCALPTGLACRDSDQPSSVCRDYEIRIYCDCGPIPTTTTTTVTSPQRLLPEVTKRPRKLNPPQCLAPGWTFWMNSNTPDQIGDRETVHALRSSYVFCDESNIEKVECRSVTNGQSYQFGGDDVRCTKATGLICKNTDKMCDDYEVRFYCRCDQTGCAYPRGMESRAIKPSQIIISSFWMEDTDGDKARLNGPSAWRPGNVELKQWIQIDLEEKQEITGIVTQGNPDSNQWVTAYLVAYSDDGVEFSFVKNDRGGDQVFQGNFDRSTEVQNMFLGPIYARYIKLIPIDWHEWISLRLEILGCNRQAISTSVPYIPETTTTAITECIHGWTQFFNVDDPEGTEDLGDEESIDRIKERYSLCPGGEITDVECKGYHNGDVVDYTQTGQFGLKCSKNVGFICNNYLQSKGEQCKDYIVRFYCSCVPTIPTKARRPHSTTPTPPKPYITPIPRTCGWTRWLNVDLPKHGPSDAGDLETIELLQKAYHVCEKPELKMIECRMSLTHHSYSESLQNDLVCDTESGFRCYNKLQIGDCHDYEVRLYCLYDWCPTPLLTTEKLIEEETTTPQVTTENPCPDGQVYDECAYSCNQTCLSFLQFLHARNDCLALFDSDECIPGCRPIRHCTAPNFWRDYATCVPREECTCLTEDGDILAPNGIIEKDCEKCQCLDNSLSCHYMFGCGETIPTGIPQLEVSTFPRPRNIETENCWTEWVNVDSPHSGGGDFESIGKIRKKYIFCQDPVEIECRSAVSKQKASDVGQKVLCDLSNGLSCWNSANDNGDCFDYEVRFFCPCPGTTVIPTVPPSAAPPSPCEDGWTEWFNSHKPNAMGEHETVQSVRAVGGYFCSSDMITSIECQLVSSPGIQALQHGVICDTQTGLVCRNSDLTSPEVCDDYKVKFYCNCPITKEATTMEQTTAELTTPTEAKVSPTTAVTCDYWSGWINEHHPDVSEMDTSKSSKGTKRRPITGDSEKKMLLRFQQDIGFCRDGKLSIIECRDAETDLDYTETGDVKLVCSLATGFRCRGREQADLYCKDYKIRYYCECLTPRTSTKAVRTTISSTMMAPTLPSTTAVPPCSTFYNIVDGPFPLPDSSFTASTSRDALSGAPNARLHSFSNSKSAGAWIASTLNSEQYLEIDLGKIQPVYGIITKGRDGAHEWVRSYHVSYSKDGITFDYVLKKPSHDIKEVFTGNYDGESEVRNMFSNPFKARYVRIQPLTYTKEIALRMDLLGCAEGMTTETPTTTEAPPLCKDEMGMENGQLSDSQISVSSVHESSSGSSAVRLNSLKTPKQSGGWVSGVLNDEQFVQIDFLEPRTITGVITEGRDDVPEWVTAFMVTYSEDGKMWNPVLNADGKIKVFPGNHDNATPVVKFFPQAVRCRYIRIIPLNWQNWISMRLEVLGCFEPYPTTISVTELSSTPVVTTELVCTEKTKLERVSCEMTGTLFSTFDGLGYEYEICDHVLMKDQLDDRFSVTIHSYCTKAYEKCKRYLKVKVDEDIIKLGPSLDYLKLNDYEVPLENLWLLERKYPAFKFYRQEDQFTFASSKYDFEVTLDSKQNVIITISKCPSQDVVGLCGFYNGNSKDDRKLPDGSISPSDEEFGNSWSIGDGMHCVQLECPEVILTKSFEVCNRFNKAPLSQCKSYLSIANHIDECVNFMCGCLQKQSSLQPSESCHCSAYETFVSECQKNSDEAVLGNWKLLLGCGMTTLESTTTTTTTEIITSTQLTTTEIICTEETKLENVRCEVAGSYFSTFDGLDYEYEICNHVLVEDRSDKFAVTIHKDCLKEPGKCRRYLKIQVDGDIITLGPGLDDLKLNNYEIPISNLWLLEEKYPELKFDRQDDQFSLVSLKYNLKVILDPQENVLISISKCPSNKVIGLCGFYNGYSSDDMERPDGTIAPSVEDFGNSWSIGDSVHCVLPPRCPEDVLMKSADACNSLNEFPFSKCKEYLNITHFIERCIDFTCDCLQLPLAHQEPESCRCSEYDAFVSACQNSGLEFTHDWELQFGCAFTQATEVYLGKTKHYTTPFMFEVCKEPMGLESGYIGDSAISVTSSALPGSGASRIRLNTQQDESGTGGWIASNSDNKPIITIDFDEVQNITGIITQGSADADMWVTHFVIQYTVDDINWNNAVDSSSKSTIFNGNSDRNSLEVHLFDTMIEASSIKIGILQYHQTPAMRLEILGCFKEAAIRQTEKYLGKTTHRTTPFMFGECKMPMGLENGYIADSAISVTSSAVPGSGASRIRLNTRQDGHGTGGWIASNSDNKPNITIDFDEVENITGIITQGSADAEMWVISFTVQYTVDNINWDYAVDSSTKSLIFPGNSDQNSLEVHQFNRMIEASSIKIGILKYHQTPAMRLEIIGCYREVTRMPSTTPIVTSTVTRMPSTTPIVTSTEVCIEYGPWLSISDPSSSFGDEEPIDKVIQASGKCGNPLRIQCRSMVTKNDYSTTGKGVICDLTHGLLCKNSDQPSGYCNNYEVRIGCWSCGTPTISTTPTPLPAVLCPEVPVDTQLSCPLSCPPDNSCDGSSCLPAVDCPCFKEGKRFKPGDIVVTSDCQICHCVLEGNSFCKPKVCPPCEEGQKLELSEDCVCSCKGCPTGTVLCPTNGQCISSDFWCDGIVNCPDDEISCPTILPSTKAPTTTTTTVKPPSSTEFMCTLEMKSERVMCEMSVNLFNTFDNLEYQYEICDHILMTEKALDLYSVEVHKDCSKGVFSCHRYILLQVDNENIKLGPGDNDIELNGKEVPVSNLWLLNKRYPNYTIRKEGNQLVVESLKYDFKVIWDSRQDVKIVMSKCPTHQVVGLCGFYTGYVDDDRLKPDGFLASGDEEFGDSWGIGDIELCEVPTCPVDIMTVAHEVCQQLNELPFSNCSSYLNIMTRIETCMSFMCECLQEGNSSIESCKCNAYGSFVEACERINDGHLFEWRLQHDCAPECSPGLEWKECGPGCELTCENYRNSEEICTDSCTPGCYCPSGLVHHKNKCIKPKFCQDCVCRGHGDPNYITFDGRYYEFQGICTYILAQHQTSDEKFNFQVLATNVECPEEPHTACADGITIIWNGHIVKRFKNKPVYFDERELENNELPFEHEGIVIRSVVNRSFVAHIKPINLVVRYFDTTYGFNVELPSFFYFNETEGLCGICNFEESDDLYHKGGFITEDVNDFAFSWLSSKSRDDCTLSRVPVPTPEPEICNFTSSPCDMFIDPTLYSRSCQSNVVYSTKPQATVCRTKIQYAQHCCENGISILEWLQESGCLFSCSEGRELSCASPCERTCDNYKSYNSGDCNLKTLISCECPANKILKDNQCVDPIQCETCDSDGHVLGDTWDMGPCKRCSCLENRTLQCSETLCPNNPLCSGEQFLDVLPQHPDACCPIYQCKPVARVACPPTVLPDCAPGYAAIVYKDGDCPYYKCECQKSLCPPLVKPTALEEDGEQYTLENVGCCQQYISKCLPETCRLPAKCAPGFKLSTYNGKCCTQYSCVPKKNVCVYEHKFEVINGTEIPLSLEEYFDKEYEAGSSWHDGLCRKCSCVESDGQFVYSCVIEICPKLSEYADAVSYTYQTEHVPGTCCPMHRRIKCVSDGVEYSVGDEWASPDGDPCKKYHCIEAPHGGISRLQKTTICDRNCPTYAIYVEPEPGLHLCCGYCKPVACEESGMIYENGTIWESAAKPCFTAECSINDNMTQIMYRGHRCPAIPSNCPKEHIVVDSGGCCSYCEVPPELCLPVEIPLHETVQFFNYVDQDHGTCKSKQLIKNLTKCSGQCESHSVFSAQLNDFESTCKCCVPEASRKRMILLDCEDGSIVKKIYHQPTSCFCSSCSGQDEVGTILLPEPY